MPDCSTPAKIPLFKSICINWLNCCSSTWANICTKAGINLIPNKLADIIILVASGEKLLISFILAAISSLRSVGISIFTACGLKENEVSFDIIAPVWNKYHNACSMYNGASFEQ